jgi:hypothetical protein
MSTKITEIPNKSACAAWCPIASFPGLVALGSKVSCVCLGSQAQCYEPCWLCSRTRVFVLLHRIRVPVALIRVAVNWNSTQSAFRVRQLRQ